MNLKDLGFCEVEVISTAERISNGYIFDISGRDFDGEYLNERIFCVNIHEVYGLMCEADELPTTT